MKMRLMLPLFLITGLFLHGCDSSDGLLDDKESTDHIVPERPEPGDPNRPRPSEDAPVITSDEHTIYDVSGEPILFRGINLEYGGEVEFNKSLGIDAVGAVGSNVVRLLLDENTTADTLERSLQQVVNANLVAILSLNGSDGNPFCTGDRDVLNGAVSDLWLDRWLPILAQDRFQPYILLNLARGWGPVGINQANSSGYSDYLANYKEAIRKIRKAGFKVPLVVDAPGCGEDFNAFLADRARELRVADVEHNTVLSLSAYGDLWSSEDELNFNLTAIANESAPIILTEMGGSGSAGETSVDHIAIMAKAAGDRALVFDIPWITIEDKATYVQTLPDPINLSGAAVLYDLFMPRQYVSNGNASVHLFLQDSAGRSATVGQRVSSLRKDNWTKIRYEIADLSSVEADAEDPIDLSDIVKLGFTLSADGKSEEIHGEIRIDNLSIERGGEPEPILDASFNSGTEGFQRSWGAGAGGTESPVVAIDGTLHIQPVWGEHANDGDGGARTQIEVSNYTPLSFDMAQPFTVSVDVFIPEEYSSENMEFTFVLKDGSWRYGQLQRVGNADLLRGAIQTISIDVEDISALPGISEQFVGVGPPNAVAFAFSGITSAKSEPIIVDNYRITVPSQLNANELFRAGFDTDTAGFSRSWGAGAGGDETPLTQANGELLVLPLWGAAANDGDGGGSATNKIEVSNYATLAIDIDEPFSITMDVFIPEEYASETLEFKVFVKDGEWRYAQIGYWGNAQLTRGITQPITVDISNIMNDASYLAPGFTGEGVPNAFGFEIGGVTTVKSEPIRVENFVVSKPEAGKETIFSLAFSAPEEVAAFEASAADSTFTESILDEARTHDFGIAPFGWLAWSWYGNSGEKAVLDLSTEESFEIPASQTVSLTERGIEIIEGPNGIAETAEPVNFPTVAE